MQDKERTLTPADDERVVVLPRLSEPRTPLTLSRCRPGDAGRAVPEAFVRSIFRRSYGAEIHTFCPELLSLARPDGSLCAVAGVRPAVETSLYSEHYLDGPVEERLAPVPRARIVEIANLAPAEVGQARWLIATLTAYLHAAGYERVVFTAVPMIFNAFARMGLRIQVLGAAERARLPHGIPDRWGRYYDLGPVVCCGDVRDGYRLLSARLDPQRSRMRRLWRQAHAMAALSGVPPREVRQT